MTKQYHLIGIGGIGMGALASLLLAKGHKVSGSDIKENELTVQLKEQGARISIGHAPQNVEGADYIVYSSAIFLDNPELRAAQIQGIPVVKRAQLLAELMKDHVGITVAGAHGKTTTTSMISHLLISANLHPTTAIGGVIVGTSSNARLGAGRYFVAEVDESDRSFLFFSPKYSVVTNIDFEHVDQYKDLDEIKEAYAEYFQRTQKDGLIFGCGEDEQLVKLLKRGKRGFKTYGFSPAFNVYATNVKYYEFSSSFDCIVSGKDLGQMILEVPGRHNILNSLAAISIGLTIGIDFDTIRRSLKTFRGVKRRFQLKQEHNNIFIIDDYAHHPTEIDAVLTTAQHLKRDRMIVIFQPHRYTRVKALLADFAQSLLKADYVIVTDIYAASEKPIEGIHAQVLVEQIKNQTDKSVIYLKLEDIIKHVLKIVRPGDLVLTLGAGDITKISDQLAGALQEGKASQEKSAQLKEV
ncbi:MAG TPA: UDP-N-acetylmuramate--L-alanine ligase [Candidatus Omnitrophota bacterium]|nr:UDP-N-acetylmuramate--L-alanine ligase [Candidatus Omnitrophota bacterium]